MVYLAVAVLAWIYVHCQYDGQLRERWLWLVGPTIAVVAHIIFTLHVRKMLDQHTVYEFAFWYWNVSMYVPFLLLPVLLYGVKLTPMCAAGIMLVAIGVLLFYLGHI